MSILLETGMTTIFRFRTETVFRSGSCTKMRKGDVCLLAYFTAKQGVRDTPDVMEKYRKGIFAGERN